MSRKLVELPPDCIITDRRTWERHEREVVRLRGENKGYAERLQYLTASNEAIRKRIEEAEELATDAMMRAEEAIRKSDRSHDVVRSCLRAMDLARIAINAITTANPRASFGGKPKQARDALSSSIAKARRFVEG